jgi:DNA polymerase-3 subunit delta
VADQGWVVECSALKGKNLTGWAREEARRRGKQLPEPAAEYLHFLCGDNPGLVIQELDKAALYLGETGPITEAVLRTTGSHSAGRSIFELVDSVAAGKSGAVRESLDGLFSEGQPPVFIAAMIARHYLQLLEVALLKRDGAQPQTISQLMEIHPYAAQKLQQQLAFFPVTKIEQILSLLLGLDHDLKQGRGEPELLLEATLGEISAMARSS